MAKIVYCRISWAVRCLEKKVGQSVDFEQVCVCYTNFVFNTTFEVKDDIILVITWITEPTRLVPTAGHSPLYLPPQQASQTLLINLR